VAVSTLLLWALVRSRPRRRRVVKGEAAPEEGRGAVPPDAPLLLTPSDEEALRWSAAHTAAVATPWLDIGRTVRATAARAGIPELRYRLRRESVAVWLWTDVGDGPLEVGRVADEMARTLAEAGLVAHRATFASVPHELAFEQRRVRVEDVEDELRHARVVVFTDGPAWRDAVLHPETPAAAVRGERLLRELAGWPHVRVVVFDDAARTDLEPVLAAHDIVVLPPEQAADALLMVPRPAEGSRQRDLDRWAAALALVPGPVHLKLAQRVRLQLELEARGHDWRALGPRGHRLQWTPEHRAQRLGWLRRVGQGSRALLDRIIGAWERLLPADGDADDRRARALLGLWRSDPTPAARALEALVAEPRQRRLVRRDLAHLVPADRIEGRPPAGAIVLPWAWADVTPAVRRVLTGLGLGAAFVAVPAPRRAPERSRARRVLLLGANAAAILLAVAAWLQAPAGPPTVVWEEGDVDRWASCAGEVCAFGGDDGMQVVPALSPGTVVRADFARREVACDEGDFGARVWRCPVEHPLDEPDAPSRRFAFLMGGSDEGRAEVAKALLATHSATAVFEDPALVAGASLVPGASVSVLDIGRTEGLATRLRTVKAPTPLDALAEVEPLDARGLTVYPPPAIATLEPEPPVEPVAKDPPTPAEPVCDGVCQPDDACAADCELVVTVTVERSADGGAWQPIGPGLCDGERVRVTLEGSRPVFAWRPGSAERERARRHAFELSEPDASGPVVLVTTADDATGEEPHSPHSLGEARIEARVGQLLGLEADLPRRDDCDGSLCGNGKEDEGEECDFGPDNADVDVNPAGCSTQCRFHWATVPAGEHAYGSPKDEGSQQRLVKFEQGFRILATEVTQGHDRPFGPRREGDRLPKVYVDWQAAKSWCESRGWTLPSELQWEAAARGGTTTAWSCGDDDACLDDVAWYSANSGRRAHEAGTKRPNAFGLYDMRGNVWEWVEDCFVLDAWERVDMATQVVNMTPCPGRVYRGGSYVSGPWYLRSALRFRQAPMFSDPFLGFRCVRGPRRQILTLDP